MPELVTESNTDKLLAQRYWIYRALWISNVEKLLADSSQTQTEADEQRYCVCHQHMMESEQDVIGYPSPFSLQRPSNYHRVCCSCQFCHVTLLPWLDERQVKWKLITMMIIMKQSTKALHCRIHETVESTFGLDSTGAGAIFRANKPGLWYNGAVPSHSVRRVLSCTQLWDVIPLHQDSSQAALFAVLWLHRHNLIWPCIIISSIIRST